MAINKDGGNFVQYTLYVFLAQVSLSEFGSDEIPSNLITVVPTLELLQLSRTRLYPVVFSLRLKLSCSTEEKASSQVVGRSSRNDQLIKMCLAKYIITGSGKLPSKRIRRCHF